MKRLVLFLVSVMTMSTMLSACGFSTFNSDELNFAKLDIKANDVTLAKNMKRQFDQMNMVGSNEYRLIINENKKREISSISSQGHAAQIKLTYKLDFELLDKDEKIHDGSYNFSQIIRNLETTARANTLTYERFYKTSRNEGIKVLVFNIQQWARK